MSGKIWWKKWLWGSLGLLVSFFLFYQSTILVRIFYWRTHNPESTALMRQRLTELRSHNPKAVWQQVWVSYEQISSHLKRAVITSEDARFLEHSGFDWEGIEKAYEKNRKKGKWVAGGSTITQQLAKNLFLSSRRTLWRKGQETLITCMLELVWNKRRILEVYLNVAEWGPGIFGAEAASQHYFHIHTSALSPETAARLAAILPSPVRYGRSIYSPFVSERTSQLLEWMKSASIP